jgi:hypothetical protein
MFKKIVNLLGWVVVLFLFCFGLYGGWLMTQTLWPGLHDDGILYSTVLINRASGLGNHFAVYTPSLILAEGKTYFASHGQLYQAIVAKFLANPEYSNLLQVVNFLNILGFLLAFTFFFLSTIRIFKCSKLCASFFGLAGAYATGAALLYLQGRPEHGIPFVLLVFGLFRELTGGRQFPDWLNGMQIGVITAISPFPGLIFGFASVMALGFRTESADKYFIGCFLQGFFALFSWCLATALVYDGSLFDLFKNTFFGGVATYYGNQFPAFRGYWVNLPFVPAVGVVFGVATGMGIWWATSILLKQGSIIRKILLLLPFIILSYIILRNAFLSPGTNYNFIPFLPAVGYWVLENATGFRLILPKGFRIFSYPIPALVLIGLFVNGFGYLRAGWLASLIESRGVPYELANDRIKLLRNSLEGNEVVFIDNYIGHRSGVVFDGLPWLFRGPGWGNLHITEKSLDFYAKYYLVMQYSKTPPERGGFVLIENAFQSDPVKFLGVEISSYAPGYGYALYQRKESFDENRTGQSKESGINY